VKPFAWTIGAVLADFTTTITLGSIIVGIIVGLAGLVVLGYGARWRSLAQISSAQAEELRRAFGDEKQRADSLYERLTDMVAERNALTVRIARLEERPNLEQLADILTKESERRSEQIGRILTRAAEALERLAKGDRSR